MGPYWRWALVRGGPLLEVVLAIVGPLLEVALGPLLEVGFC